MTNAHKTADSPEAQKKKDARKDALVARLKGSLFKTLDGGPEGRILLFDWMVQGLYGRIETADAVAMARQLGHRDKALELRKLILDSYGDDLGVDMLYRMEKEWRQPAVVEAAD